MSCEALSLLNKIIKEDNFALVGVEGYDAVEGDKDYESIHKISKVLKKCGKIPFETAKALIENCSLRFGSKAICLFEYLEVEDSDLNSLLELLSLVKRCSFCSTVNDKRTMIKELENEINDLFVSVDNFSSEALKNGTKPANFTPDIFAASTEGNIASVAYLFAQNNDVINAKDENGQTPLILASWKGKTDLVKYLLSKNANVNDTSNIGSTALMYASEGGNTKIIELLLSHGASINQKNSTGSTALCYAALRGQYDTAKFLIEHGANVNEGDQNGATPLFCATFSNSMNVVQLLVENGADIRARNKSGRMAKEYSKTNEMAEYYYSLEM